MFFWGGIEFLLKRFYYDNWYGAVRNPEQFYEFE